MKFKINEVDMSAFAVSVFTASAASMLTKPCWPMMMLNVISGGYLGVRTYLNDVCFGRGSTKSEFASLNYNPEIDNVTYVDENYHLGHDGCDGNCYDSFAEAEAELRSYEKKVFTNGVLTAHDWTGKLVAAIDDFRGWTIDDVDRACIMYDGKHYWVHLPTWHSIPEKLGYLIQNGSDTPYKIVDCQYKDAYERVMNRCVNDNRLTRFLTNERLENQVNTILVIWGMLAEHGVYECMLDEDLGKRFTCQTLDNSMILKNPDTDIWELWLPIIPLAATKSSLTMEDDSNKLKEES